jgi:hypothetical protein
LGDDRNIAEVWVAGAQVREGDNFAGAVRNMGLWVVLLQAKLKRLG